MMKLFLFYQTLFQINLNYLFHCIFIVIKFCRYFIYIFIHLYILEIITQNNILKNKFYICRYREIQSIINIKQTYLD